MRRMGGKYHPCAEAERITLGEECDFHFVSSVLSDAIEMWNTSIQRLRERLEDPQELCKQVRKYSGSSVAVEEEAEEEDVESAVNKLAKAIGGKLLTINLKASEANFTTLSRQGVICRVGVGARFARECAQACECGATIWFSAVFCCFPSVTHHT